MAPLGVYFQMGTRSAASRLRSAPAAILEACGLPGSIPALLGTLQLPLQETVALPVLVPLPPSSVLRLLAILEAEIGSQKVRLKTSPTLPGIPDSQEGLLSGH